MKDLRTVVLFITEILLIALADDNEFRLYRKLTEKYILLDRPVANNTFAVKVYLGVVLQQIIDVVCLRLLFL